MLPYTCQHKTLQFIVEVYYVIYVATIETIYTHILLIGQYSPFSIN